MNRAALADRVATATQSVVARLIDQAQAMARSRRVTPRGVVALAALCMKREDGRPVVPAAHHWLWLDLLCDPTIRRLLIIAPPESAKTTWIVAFLAATIAVDPESPRLLASSSGDIAARRSVAVRSVVESAEFRALFPAIERAAGMVYAGDEWSVAPHGVPFGGRVHPSVSAYGVDSSSIVGSRALWAVGDDIHDWENSRTAYQRDLVHTWIQNSFLTRVTAETGRAILIGTLWDGDDAYVRLSDSGGFVTCHIPALSAGPNVFATLSYPDDYTGAIRGERLSSEDVARLAGDGDGDGDAIGPAASYYE